MSWRANYIKLRFPVQRMFGFFPRCLLYLILIIDVQELTAKQVEEIIPDASSRQQALNFLLGVGLFKLLQDKNKKVSFRAVAKTELVA